MTYRVIKNKNFQFTVSDGQNTFECMSRNKNKKDAVLCGDFAELTLTEHGYVISSIKGRKNSLIRPAIANVDKVIIVISHSPSPDYALIDKLIINCFKQGMEVVLCVNKCDEALPDISCYKDAVDDVVFVSAKYGDVKELVDTIEGLCCFAGQSAVGKTSLINAITGRNEKVGDLSRIERGKNTTTSSEIFRVGNGYVADTPGFSLLDVFDIKAEELKNYYRDFKLRECYFGNCTHVGEPDCGVKDAVERGEIDKGRYLRYIDIYAKLKNQQNKNFRGK
mgnify:FL=1